MRGSVKALISRLQTKEHEADCDDQKPKVPTECLMTGAGNEPARRPDASRKQCRSFRSRSRSISERAGAKTVRRKDPTMSEASILVCRPQVQRLHQTC